MTDLHQQLLDSDAYLHVSCAGAGGTLIKHLWSQPGMSKYMAGSFMPYHNRELEEFLGHPVDHAVCPETAIRMAIASYMRAQAINAAEDNGKRAIGLAVSAALPTTRPLKGGHRYHLAVAAPSGVFYQENIFGDGTTTNPEARYLMESDILAYSSALLEDVLRGKGSSEADDVTKNAVDLFMEWPHFSITGRRLTQSLGGSQTYLPGTFNPLHDGHRQMVQAAESASYYTITIPPRNDHVCYLISTSSPHKGDMPLHQLLDTAAALHAERWKMDSCGPRSFEFTAKEPLFIDKARARPNSAFVIGADTMQRMLDPKWGPNIEIMLNEMANLRTLFLVMGRTVDGKWTTCRDIPVRWPDQDLFRPLPGNFELSSTDIRNKKAPAHEIPKDSTNRSIPI